ncbi:MAG: hypothetical protein ACI304_09855 [Lepagella sp.]
MKRVITFLLAAIVTLSAVPQDPISRPGKKKQEQVDAQKKKEEQRRKQQEAEKRSKAKEEQERKEQEERERKEREEQERLAREEQEHREREEKERKAHEEQERRAKEEQARREREEQERKAREAQLQGTINGYEWVDLGLSVKWATKNIDAYYPYSYGNFYAWGETSTKSVYSSNTRKSDNKRNVNIAGNQKYDVARSKWGGSWRMPTKEEFQELVNKCTWTWIAVNGHNGYRVTSMTTGKSIFLPAAGHAISGPIGVGGIGAYWSSTPDSDTRFAYMLKFLDYTYEVVKSLQCFGCSVRPVTE